MILLIVRMVIMLMILIILASRFRFVSETVGPALHQLAREKGHSKVVLVIDNAPYHSRLMDEFKRPPKRKADMKFWLSQHAIEYGERELNAELWLKITEFLKNYRGEKYFLDAHLKTLEIEVVRMPPYHCDFNPIEKCWAWRKQFVAAKNQSKHSLSDLTLWWEESRTGMTIEHIQKLFDRVICIEDQFAEIDSRELEDGGIVEDVEEYGGDLVPLNVDVADDNDVMPGFYELDDFEY